MERQRAKELLPIIEAYANGAEIELWVDRGSGEGYWQYIKLPNWNSFCEYRIKPTKPSIDWSHVHPDFKWLAFDDNGDVYLYTKEPKKGELRWDCFIGS